MTTRLKSLGDWVAEVAELTEPDRIHWCAGTDEEYRKLIDEMLERFLNLRIRKPFTDHSADCDFIDRLIAAARDVTLHGVEKLQPVLQRRFRHGLPLIKTLLPLKKNPFASDMVGVHMDLHNVYGNAFQTDFRFRNE
jgi:hypothetical protein